MNVNLPYGSHTPNTNTRWVRLLTRIGLSRGRVNKWIGRYWKRCGQDQIDHEVRGIKYRLQIKYNVTDRKILTSSSYYEKKEIDALSQPLQHSDIANLAFIDLGANTGYYSLELFKRGYQLVLAIEPNPVTLSIFRTNIGFNEAEQTITVIPCCVGPGHEVELSVSKGLGTAHVITTTAKQGQQTIKVPSRCLVDILAEQNIQRIGGIKIDVEGYEDQALLPFFESAPITLWPEVIVIEHCHSSDWNTDVIAHLLSRGYQRTGKTRGNTILTRSTTFESSLIPQNSPAA